MLESFLLLFLMELIEPIEAINGRLVDYFGIDTLTGLPIWRVVWSEDQVEKRLVNTLDSGIILTQPVVREVPKYRQWIKERYVLERLVVVPESQRNELPSSNLSYEPIWVFMDGVGNYLPPKWEVAQLIVDTVYAALGKSSLAKYKDPDMDAKDPRVAIAKQRARVDEIVEELFGNESDVTDALAHKEGIVVPNINHTKES